MEISKIVIENFKGIERVEMGPIKPINILIGRNNSGKTSVLRALEYVAKYWDEKGIIRNENNVIPEDFRLGSKVEQQKISVRIFVSQSEKERRELWNDIITSWNDTQRDRSIRPDTVERLIRDRFFESISFDFMSDREEPAFRLKKVQANVKDLFLDIAFYARENRTQGRPSFFLAPIFRMFSYDSSASDNSEAFHLPSQENWEHILDASFSIAQAPGDKAKHVELKFCKDMIVPVYSYIKKRFAQPLVVPPFRHAQERGSLGGNKPLDPQGNQLVTRLSYLRSNRTSTFHKLVEFAKKIAPEVGQLNVRQIEGRSELEIAYEWGDDEIVRLSNMGGGMEQLLILGCFIINHKKSCLLWEEPETHLHPGAQESLLNEFEKQIKDRLLFITTHSPVFVRESVKIAVHTLSNVDGRSATGTTLSSKELHQAVNIIGSRPGHLAQADIVLYVEGKSGVAVVEEWIKKWPERDRVLGHLQLVVQSSNVEELGTEDFDLTSLKKVTPNMIIFADKDNEEGSKEPKKSRKILLKKCGEAGIPCIITDKRKIEDYFTENAVKKVLPSSLVKSWTYDPEKSMGEQLPNGWKKHNRRIAAAMDWDDVSKHKDLMDVFSAITEYANKLKPDGT